MASRHQTRLKLTAEQQRRLLESVERDCALAYARGLEAGTRRGVWRGVWLTLALVGVAALALALSVQL